MTGLVYLVGAGPGDPGLLTLRGRECLGRAECVVYDYLANPRLLDFAPPDAERVLAGKHGGGPKVPQEKINEILIDRAQQGKIVVRLKGGDPFIFGRGGEEALALRKVGIRFEIVPGVTSAVAAPAYAGIPLTHRDHASNVIFTTGYEYPEKSEPAVRWAELARAGNTVVILMTSRQIASNMERMIAAGLPAETPAALIEWGTRADQLTVSATVGTLGEAARHNDVGPPALAVVGRVVSMREQLAWHEQRPLFGRRIVVTRPRHQAESFSALLEEMGAEVVLVPTIAVEPLPSGPLDGAIEHADSFDWLIFTSANGVRIFFERMAALGSDVRRWHRAQFAAIGPQTARALQARGIHVDRVPGDYRAEGLLECLTDAEIVGKRILLPRAAGARDILPRELARRGAEVEEVHTYESRLPAADIDELRAWFARGVDLVTFTSSSTAQHFAMLVEDDLPSIVERTQFGCIGPITADTCRQAGMPVAVEPEAYTVEAFAEAISAYFHGRPLRRQIE